MKKRYLVWRENFRHEIESTHSLSYLQAYFAQAGIFVFALGEIVMRYK